MNGEPPINQREIKIKFLAKEFRATAGCNGIWGEYETNGSKLIFQNIMITEMGCEPMEVMDQEQVYWRTLRSVTNYRLVEKRLELLDRDGNTVLDFVLIPPTPDATLESTQWELVSFLDGQIVHAYADAPKITLRLDNNRVQGSGGCNIYSASYKLNGNSLRFENINQTKMACPGKNAMEQENEFIGILSSIDTFQINEDKLSILTEDGRGIYFKVQP